MSRAPRRALQSASGQGNRMVIAAASPQHLVRPRSAPRASPKGTAKKNTSLSGIATQRGPALHPERPERRPCAAPLRCPLFPLHVTVINTITVTAAKFAFLRNMDVLDITTESSPSTEPLIDYVRVHEPGMLGTISQDIGHTTFHWAKGGDPMGLPCHPQLDLPCSVPISLLLQNYGSHPARSSYIQTRLALHKSPFYAWPCGL
ncbi:hypothetical protein COCC4DRAFT_145632 [Bipolaris maydis ATCC 48331]|uniref:Uncharacterized protein n=2 Tax=Cochliobolus heterostrophus TaxID=5016 RepID=M2U1Y3_COCH5|nr:uncharacterized protein COCC4DRAFT_145632 [Bipolaris maydis ATCC 48331]EMD88051.1 hypothetical protein COCHEDRAFT_1033395 [Bipolaris maydis C5]ENI02366.1 hypothetical protein COCC4DRAFT_145632 [Bipolaris maydis ATCC 48331]KAJ6207023.1 hypothetical protein PSV09DRAFT_1033395 [Bipolaris maydis]